LKEFEALAREALGSDEGVAGEENYTSTEGTPTEGIATEAAPAEGAEPHEERGPATVGKDLVEEEKVATSEGMPAGETDESPKAAIVGE